MDIVAHVNRTQKSAILVSIDFEKCFDRVEHQSIFGAMKYFGFRPKFIQYVKLFFNKFEICTQNAGYVSDYFPKTRSINQGCPISPFLYNLCGEIMSHLIKGNPNIKGIKIGYPEVENVITQFADDTGLFLLYEENTLKATVETLTYVQKNTGLKVSYDKTCIYRLGSIRHTNAKLFTQKPMKWSNDDIEMLGVTITNDVKQNNRELDVITDKMEGVSKTWYYRQLTLIGKALLINTLMCSLFTYHLAVVPLVTPKQLKRVENIINEFLWKGKRPKIPLKVLQNPIKSGGLKITNVFMRQKALYVNWIGKLEKDVAMEAAAYEVLDPHLRGAI